MQLFSYDKIYNFMGVRKPFLAFSLLLILGSVFMLATKGVNFGIDFAGGTVVQLRYDHAAPINDVRDALAAQGYADVAIQEFGDPKEIVIKLPATTQALGTDIGDIMRDILGHTGSFDVRRVDMVGPKVGAELREKGIMALSLAIIGILIYVALRFEWRFAIASVIALVHDITITSGFVSVSGIAVNLDILAALLTILGYSLNDTIVVFDRIREQLTESKETQLTDVINEAVSMTLSRTTLTSLTTFFVVLTLYLFGGELINGLSATLLMGIIVGTYSSIFIAAALLSFLGFSVKEYRGKQAQKAKLKAEKERMRSLYEQGTV